MRCHENCTVIFVLTGAVQKSKQLCSTQYKYNEDPYEVYVNKQNFIHAKSFNKSMQNAGTSTVNSDLYIHSSSL